MDANTSIDLRLRLHALVDLRKTTLIRRSYWNCSSPNYYSLSNSIAIYDKEIAEIRKTLIDNKN